MISLPKITADIHALLGGSRLQLIRNGDWTQDAVDFARVLNTDCAAKLKVAEADFKYAMEDILNYVGEIVELRTTMGELSEDDKNRLATQRLKHMEHNPNPKYHIKDKKLPQHWFDALHETRDPEGDG